ncbi:hypothetical protein JUNP479_1944 [Aeromonas jandaei]|nr:hypothetical protein JUNP479_1944 [Aeromonas jandaei]
MPLYVVIFGLLAQGVDLGGRFLSVGFAKAALAGSVSGHQGLKGFGFADRKQPDLLRIAARPSGCLGNTFFYLKQVLGNLVHVSLVIL